VRRLQCAGLQIAIRRKSPYTLRTTHILIQYRKNFSFKCHREEDENKVWKCYAVNAIDFHPQQGTFVTGGADGAMHVWDKDAKNRISTFATVGTPITSLAFNHAGDMLAYAVSYDWSKGHAYNTPQTVKKVMIHPVTNEEVLARSKR
jgi:mRNA export factor